MIFNAVSRQKEKMLSLQPFREAMGFTGKKIPPSPSEQRISFPSRLPSLKESSELLIEEALVRAKGNQAVAAGLLGISPQALSKRLRMKSKN